MKERIHQILHDYWGYNSFRPLQEDIICSILDGNDTLALLPTGGGKSICFQVPAIAQQGLCLVISPLIALMKDQVENLRKRNITAYAIYSGMSRKDVENVLRTAGESNCKFLYVSPERLETNLFKEFLLSLGVSMLVVDEAHCISQWGYDFRPPYLKIAALREELREVPVLALTASATPEVQKDICDKLEFNREQIFRQAFIRSNLSYSIFMVDSRINKIMDILQKVNGSAIVYCRSRKRTRELSDLLNMNGIVADYYHAGLGQEERSAKQESWISNKTRTIVCTNAFGMGIDKPDVRVVIHADLPDSLENYYQEAGRAGRDGKKAYAVLLYDQKDLAELKDLASTRFPSFQDIRLVYQSLGNYLQIPRGSGIHQSYDFDLTDFRKKFNLDINLALYSMKALEQDGWITFNEQVFRPSKIQFTCLKRELESFQQEYSQYDPLIKAMLRSYEGIFDQPTAINEKNLSYILCDELENITQQLQFLDAANIIRYEKQKEQPQVTFLENRVSADELNINPVNYETRKKQFQKRVRAMSDYVTDTTCRSKIICTYFGDDNSRDCGICDNCLKGKNELSKEEFEKIHSDIINIIKSQPSGTKELLTRLSIKKEKAWKVIHFLQAENKIEVDNLGMIRLK